jgi:hypothetical protein
MDCGTYRCLDDYAGGIRDAVAYRKELDFEFPQVDLIAERHDIKLGTGQRLSLLELPRDKTFGQLVQ